MIWSAYGIGRPIWNRFHIEHPAISPFAASTLLGFGLMAYLVMGLLFSQALSSQSLFIALVILGLLGAWSSISGIRSFSTRPVSWREIRSVSIAYWPLGLAILFPLWIAFCSALMPPTQSDALRYHLTVPALYLKHGGFEVFPTLSFSNFPFLIDYLFVFPVGLGADSGAKLLHAFFFGLCIGMSARIAWSWCGLKAGAMAALLIATTPFMPIFAAWGFIEFGLAAYALMALQAAMVLRDRLTSSSGHAWRACLAFGLFAALLLGCKYTSIAMCGIMGILIITASRDWSAKAAGRRAGYAIGAGLIALALSSPWFIKNMLLFGNPVFPFGGSVFPTPGWSDFNQAFFTYHAGLKGSLNAMRQAPLWQQLLDMVSLPFRMTIYSGVAARPEHFGSMPTGVLWLGAAFLLVIGRDWRPWMKEIILFGVFLFLFWGYSYRDIRFLVPFFIIAAPVFACVWAYWLDRMPALRWYVALAVMYNLSTTFGLTLIPGTYMPWWVVSGQVSHDEYLLEISEDTRHQNQAFRFLDETADSDSRVLLHGIQEPYYCNQDYVWADWFNTDVLIQWSWETPSPEGLVDRLQQENIRYLVHNYGNINQYNQTFLPYYRFFRLPLEAGTPLLNEYIRQEYTRLHYPFEYEFWMNEFLQRLDQAEAQSPSVDALKTLLEGDGLIERFRYDENPDDPREGIVVYEVPQASAP